MPTYPIYKEIPATEFSQATIEQTNEDGSVYSIPCKEDNSDYQTYLRWLENPDADTWVEPELTK